MKLIPQFTQSRSLESLCQKYGCPLLLGLRSFADEEVKRIVMDLSMLVKRYRFGHGMYAINAVYILEAAEPLEALAFEDVSVTRMRVLLLFAEQQYEEAARLLSTASTLYSHDSILRCMRAWLDKEGNRGQ